MPRPLAILVFVFTELLLLPVSLLGAVIYTLDLLTYCARHRISLTAYKVAVNRWFLHKVRARPDPVTEKMLEHLPVPRKTVLSIMLGPTLLAYRLSELKWETPTTLPSNTHTFVQQRTEFIDNILFSELENYDQVVLLGAGFDSRPYLSPLKNSGVEVFEVDREPTQAAKRRALHQARISTDHVRYVHLDFEKDSLIKKLSEAGYNPSLRTLFLWEGVVYYLTPVAVDMTLLFMTTESGPGSSVVFDYPSREYLEDPPFLLQYALRWLDRIGESWHFGLPTDPPIEKRAQEFLEKRGWSLDRREDFGPLHGANRPFGGVLKATHHSRRI